MTLPEMAEKLGLKDASGLRHAIKRGKLAARPMGRFYVVSEAEYARWVAGPEKPRGRPRRRRPEEPER